MLLIFEVLVLVGLSAIFSGLNIALMSLPLNDLKRKSKLGDQRAISVLPLRQNSHLTLASILLTNVAVISATSLVIEHRYNGIIAGISSTLLIVIFGEVLPQAWFARFALNFCALFSPLLKLVIILAYPIAKPLQLLLDKLIGHEGFQLHTRSELGLIIKEQRGSIGSELDEDEVEIMQGALNLSNKRVSEIMTPIGQVYYLTVNSRIDAEVIDDIKENNYSRIPIFNADLNNCAGVLLMKDLVDIDFDEQSLHITDLPLHSCTSIGSKTALDTLFRKFIGAKSHLMVVTRDDRIAGIVTIEDLIEEILGHEIEDESDRSRLIAR